MGFNYAGCVADYEQLEPWFGRCDRCGDLHLVDSAYSVPRAACDSRPLPQSIAKVLGWLNQSTCQGTIRYLTSIPEVAAAWKLGGPTAAWDLYCDFMQRTGFGARIKDGTWRR